MQSELICQIGGLRKWREAGIEQGGDTGESSVAMMLGWMRDLKRYWLRLTVANDYSATFQIAEHTRTRCHASGFFVRILKTCFLKHVSQLVNFQALFLSRDFCWRKLMSGF